MSEPRRLAFCITDLDAGGAERALVRIVTGLAGSDWSPKVFCLAGPGELVSPLEARGIPVECLGATSLRALPAIRQLTRGLREWRTELLQTFMFHGNLAGRIAAWRAGVPVVVSGLRVAERDARWRMQVDRWTQRFVTSNVAVSQGVADFSINEVGLSRDRVVVIPNGVDFEHFRSAPPEPLSRFGIPAGSRVITSIGRLHPQKAPELLLEAAAPLVIADPALQLLYVGDGPLRSELETLASRLGIADRVHFAGRTPDTAGILKSSAVLVLPSRWEGMPNVLLEAMAAGCPVIASDVEGSREVIEHAATGRLFPAGDVAALTSELQWVLSRPDFAQTLAQKAQVTMRTEFEWSRVVTAYHCLYARLLNSQPDVNNPAGG